MPDDQQATPQAEPTGTDAIFARGGMIDRRSVQLVANLAHHIHERAVAIERQTAGADVVATLGQSADIVRLSEDLFDAADALHGLVQQAAGVVGHTITPVSSSAEVRSPGAIHDGARNGDGAGVTTAGHPAPSSGAA